MTPAEVELVCKRLMALQAPKATWTGLLTLILGSGQARKSVSAQVLVLAVLLTSWLPFTQSNSLASLDLVEFFAGVARISRLAACSGLHAARVDISYDAEAQHVKGSQKRGSASKPGRSCMDLLSSPGFLPPGDVTACVCHVVAQASVFPCEFN